MITAIVILSIIVAALAVSLQHTVKMLDVESDESERLYGLLTEAEESEALMKKKFYEGLQIFDSEMKKKNQEAVEVKAVVHNLKQFLEDGVFYDKHNDSIVIVKELERLGDL